MTSGLIEKLLISKNKTCLSVNRHNSTNRCVHAKYFLCLTGDHSVCKTGFVVKPVTSLKLWVHTILFLSFKCKCLNVARIFNFWTQRLIDVLSVGSSRICVASRKFLLTAFYKSCVLFLACTHLYNYCYFCIGKRKIPSILCGESLIDQLVYLLVQGVP